MSTMKAIPITELGGLDVLSSSDVPLPTAGPDDVLIKVHAVSINPVETKIRAGKWAGGNLPAGSILGFDASGTIHSIGANVPQGTFKQGDSIYLLGSTLPSHSNAEYMVADYRCVALKPSTMSFEDSAAIPLVGLTAWELMVEQMEIRSGEENAAILIINGAGGVGSMATQIAKNILGMKTVIATASREASIQHTKALGATHVISHREKLAPQIAALNLDKDIKIKYILVLTTITKDILDQVIDIAETRGKIGLAVQGTADAYEGLGKGQRKSLAFYWGFVFTKMIMKWQLETQGQSLQKLASLIDDGKIKPITSQKLSLTVQGLRDAHALMENGQTVGKVILTVPGEGAFQ